MARAFSNFARVYCLAKCTLLFTLCCCHGEKRKFLISLILNDIYCTAQNTMVVCTFRMHFLNSNYYTV